MLLSMPKELCEGRLFPSFERNGVKLSYYGMELCAAEIDGTDIEDMPEFNIPKAMHNTDELYYRITDQILQ